MKRFAFAAVVLAVGLLSSGRADAGWKWGGCHKKKSCCCCVQTCCAPSCGTSSCGGCATGGCATGSIGGETHAAPMADGAHSAPAPQPYDEKAGLPADKGPMPATAAPAPPAKD